MPIDIYNKEFQNWVKGVFGLNTTRTALCDHISDKLDEDLIDIPPLELKQFFICLGLNKISRFRTQQKNSKRWGCSHDKCKKLMERFINNHEQKLFFQDKFIWKEKASSGSIGNPNTDNQEEDLKWKVMKLYLHIDKDEAIENYTSLKCLDIARVIKLMKSCTLFFPDGSAEPYKKVLEWRNKLMHSPDNMMKEDEIQEIIKWTKALLDCLDITEKTYYKDAIAGLKDIAKKDFVIKYQSEESKNILANVKEAKTVADELHKNIEDDEQLRTSKRLLDMLESIGCFGITENKGLEYKQAEYKSKIKEVFEQKSVTIELDKAECDEESEDFKELDVLQQHTKQTLQEVEVVIKRPESEEMEVRINSLNKELESKKSQEVQLIRLKKDSEESAKTIEHLQNEVKSLEKENIVIDIEEQEDDLNLDENYKFFMNEIPSRPNGDYIDTIHKEWWGDYKRLEEDRNYMQWLFPIRGKCCDRPYQELFPHEIQKIRDCKEAQDRLLLSYKMMLDFYGMTLSDEEDGTILFTFNFDERMENLNKSEQNHNRITRILKCLGELGFEHLKKKFIRFIINQIFISKRLTNMQEICRNYWIEILKDPRERAEMKTHFENPGCLIL